MKLIQPSLQKVFIECLESMLGPIVRLTLYCGLGHSEFAAVARKVFIDVASEDFGVRGRPANASKVAAITGLPRKAVSSYRIKHSMRNWTPDDEASPINTIIHYWRFDERFCSSPGEPLDLEMEGDRGFSGLVKSYSGDIPDTALRQALLREGIVEVTVDGMLKLRKTYSFPECLDEDFLRNAAFSIRHHAETIVENARAIRPSERDSGLNATRLFERIAWSRRLNVTNARNFETWVRKEGAEFILNADEYIAKHEDLSSDNPELGEFVTGVGIFFFRR